MWRPHIIPKNGHANFAIVNINSNRKRRATELQNSPSSGTHPCSVVCVKGVNTKVVPGLACPCVGHARARAGCRTPPHARSVVRTPGPRAARGRRHEHHVAHRFAAPSCAPQVVWALGSPRHSRVWVGVVGPSSNSVRGAPFPTPVPVAPSAYWDALIRYHHMPIAVTVSPRPSPTGKYSTGTYT